MSRKGKGSKDPATAEAREPISASNPPLIAEAPEQDPAPDAPLHVFARGTLGLMVFLAPLTVCNGMFDLYDGSKRLLAHLMVDLILLVGAIAVLVTGRLRARLGPWHLGFAFFLLSQVPGVMLAVNRVVAIEELVHRLLWFAVLVMASQLYRGGKGIGGLFVATAAGAFMAAMIGHLQAGGLDFPNWLPQVAVPASCFGNKNMAAEYISMIIPLILWGSFVARSWIVGAMLAMVNGFLGMYIIFTITRASWLALSISVGLMGAMLLLSLLVTRPDLLDRNGPLPRLALESGRRGILVIGCGVLGLLAGIAMSYVGVFSVQVAHDAGQGAGRQQVWTDIIVQEGTNLESYSVSWRFRIWANSLALAKDHFFFGVGLANWKFWYPKYFDDVAVDTDFNSRVQADTPHNDYLQYFGEAGFCGLIGFGAFLLTLGLLWWILFPRVFDGPYPAMLIGISGLACVYATSAGFSFPVQKAAPTFLLFVWLGVLAAQAGSTWTVPLELRYPGTMIPCYLVILLSLHVFRREHDYFEAERGFKRGYLLVNEGKVYEAWQSLSRAHVIRPDNHALSVFAGGIAMELGMIDEGLNLNQKALNSHPYFTNAFNQLGNAHWRKKQYDEAEAAYRKSLEIHPTLTEPLRNLASLMLARSRLPEAIQLLETLIKASPSVITPEDQLDLAEAYRLTGKLDQARVLFTELQLKLPQDIRVSYALGEIARSTGKYEDAEKQFRHVLGIVPEDSRAKLGLSRTLTAMGRGAEAQEVLKEVISTNPGSEMAQAEMAESVRRNGDLKGAAEMYRALLTKNPKSALFHSKLAAILLGLDDRQGASDHFQMAVQADPRRMLDWARLGRIHVEGGNFAEAKTIFEAALRVDPNDRKILNEMGLVLNRLGQKEQAVEHFQRASQQPDVEAEVFFNLGSGLSKLGRNEEAVRALRTFVALWRGDPKFRAQAEQEISRLTGGP